MHPILRDVVKNKLEPILDAELILLQQVLLQYLHLFLVCEWVC